MGKVHKKCANFYKTGCPNIVAKGSKKNALCSVCLAAEAALKPETPEETAERIKKQREHAEAIGVSFGKGEE
jgi:hypothetical protein